MKRINSIFSSSCLALLLLAAGCKEDLPESANVEQGKESLSFTTDAGSHTVKIETSHPWTATASESWLTISPDKGGSGQSELTLKAVSNATASAREATVTIQVGHKISTIRISQAQQDVLDLNKPSETVSWLAGSIRLTVSANVSDYKVVSDASWLRESPLRSVSDSTLVFVYDENPTYEPRTAKVSIRKDALSSLFTVTQGGKGALYFVLERAEVPASDTQYALKLMKNTPSNGLKLIRGSDWVSLSGTRTRAVPQEETVPLTLQPNKATTPREALVVIGDESTGKLLTDTFTLVQIGVEHLLHPEQIAYSAKAEGETLTIPVQSSGLFEVLLPSETSAWLTGSNGIQLAGSLSFTVSENKKPEARTASITLRLQDNPDMEVAITITQVAADIPATERLPRMYNLRSLSTVIETEPVNLGAFKATVEYDESDNSSNNWLTDIHTQGGKLHFQVGDNSASTKRSAILRITPEEGSAVSIRVNQSSAEETYIELEKPGTLASFIDGFHMGDYKNVRLHSANGLNADDLNTLRSTSIGVKTADLTGVTMTTLPAGAFKGSRTIQTVKLPETLTRIGANAFENCTVLEELPVPAGVKEIGARAFAGAFTGSVLSDLDLSVITALVSIDSAAFEGCNTLISLKLPNNLVTIGSHAFNECYSLTGSLVGSLIFPATLTTIGREAFYNCKNLSGTLTLGSAITSIGARAFMKCASLESLDFKTSKLSVIEVETFKECRGLSGGTASSSSVIQIPSGVTHIARGAFEDTGMSTVDLPATMSEIGRRAFYNCRQLSVVICRKSGTPPSLDVDSPEETFGGVTQPADRTLNVPSADQGTYKTNIPWQKATPGWTTGSIQK